MDLVSRLLQTFHLNAKVSIRAQFCGQWALEHHQAGHASFHLVARGHCWMHPADGTPAMRLDAGDLVVLPRDAPHTLSASRASTTSPAPEFLPLDRPRGDGVSVVCGHFEFQGGLPNPLLDALPDVLIIGTRNTRDGRSLASLVDMLVREASDERPGHEAILDRLADALFIQALRWHCRQGEAAGGLAAALADPAVHRALALMHDQPDLPWTASRLGREVNLSRSAFVKRFSETMSEAPMTYLTRWRMQMARLWLAEGGTVADVAERCGYATDAGFSKAFKRYHGVGPGAVRRECAPAVRSATMAVDP